MAERPASAAAPVVARPDSLTLILFAVVVLIGGGNFIAVRFTVLEMPPFWSAASRFAVAALLFWIAAAIRRDPVPRRRTLAQGLAAGALAIGLFYGLLYWALTVVPAGAASILAALTPLVTFLLAVAHRMEAFRPRALVGALVAVLGIGVAFFRGPEGALVLPPLLAILLALGLQAEGALTLKRLTSVSPIMANAVGLTIGAAILGVASLIVGEKWTLPVSPATWAAFIYLILLGSLALFYLYVVVIRRWTASGTAYAFVLFPFVTVTLEWLLTDEPLTVGLIAGAALVLAGVWIGALSRGRS